MRNISNFEKIPKRGGCWMVTALLVMRLILKWMRDQTGSQCRSLTYFCDAGVLVDLGSGTYSEPGDWVTMSAREFCILCSFLTWVSGTSKSNDLQ